MFSSLPDASRGLYSCDYIGSNNFGSIMQFQQHRTLPAKHSSVVALKTGFIGLRTLRNRTSAQVAAVETRPASHEKVPVPDAQPSVAHGQVVDSPNSDILNAQRLLIERCLNSRWQKVTSAQGRQADPSPPQDCTPGPSAARKQQTTTSNPSAWQKSEVCTTWHPGSVCCSKTSVHKDPLKKVITINCQTTVSVSNNNFKASLHDLEQLGLLAASQRLQEAAAQLGATNTTASIQRRHEAVQHVLSKGQVVHAEKSTNQFGHITYRCVLEDPESKHRMRAMVKPFVRGHADGWHRVEVEAAAYKLNRLLGMDYVPPTVYRCNVDVDWINFAGASFMYWAEEGRELRTEPMENWGSPPLVVLSDARILDVLIQNSDRHHGHFLLAAHWAQGTGRSPAQAGWHGRLLPAFIDHAAGFRPEAYVDLRHENAFETGPTRHISAKTFLRLRCLDRATLATAMAGLLSPAEIDNLMRRRDDILAYFDDMVREHGYENVVIEV